MREGDEAAGPSEPRPPDPAPDLLPGTLEGALQELAQLRSALEHRSVIGQATDIVMERHHVGADEAFAMLSKVS